MHSLIFHSVFLWLTVFLIGSGDLFHSNVHVYNHKYLPKQVLNHLTYTDFVLLALIYVSVQFLPQKKSPIRVAL